MYQGSLVALITPMKSDISIDWLALQELVNWHLQEGTHGLVVAGTTGESATLSLDEHVEVIRRVVDQVNGRIPVIAGTGANSVHEAVQLTQAAKDLKADACLLVTPYYNKPTQEGLFLHHQYLAKNVCIPQILYNVPSRTGVDLSPTTVSRLAKVPGIIGIKDATGDMLRLESMRCIVNENFLYLSGDDESAIDFIERGGHGSVSVTANIAPKAVSQMCEFALSGEIIEARSINDKLMPLHKALFLETNPIPVKWALSRMGKINGGIRLPMTALSSEYHDTVMGALKYYHGEHPSSALGHSPDASDGVFVDSLAI